MRRLIKIYDTTLRDGTQGEGVSFSMEDKIRLCSRLDAFGIHYIEGGWPGSNPKDLRFFRRMQDVTLKHAKLAAFSMTRRARNGSIRVICSRFGIILLRSAGVTPNRSA